MPPRYDQNLDVTLRRAVNGSRKGSHLVRTPHLRIPWGVYLVALVVKLLWRGVRVAVRHPKVTLAGLLFVGAWWTVLSAAADHGWLTVGPAALAVTGLLLAAGKRHLADVEGGTHPRPPLRAVARAAILYRRQWRDAMKFAGLTQQDRGQELLPTLLSVKTEEGHDVIRLRMRPGQTAGDYGKAAERVAQTFGAREVRVRTVRGRAHLLDLVVLTGDVLEESVRPAPGPAEVDLEAIEVGRREDGQPFTLPVLYSHLLVAGLTGSGKGSVIWSLLLGMAPAIKAGTVKVLAIDPKGGMELALGRPLFGKFVCGGPEEIAEALDLAVDGMRKRAAHLMMAESRKMVPSVDMPLIVIIVDEAASITSYVPDPVVKRQITNALSMLLTQGRAVGYSVIAATQDPRKEVLSMRDLFSRRVLLRAAEARTVDMVLGDGARDSGALADQISDRTPGVGYVAVEGVREPVRVRFAHVTDDGIVRACKPHLQLVAER